MRGKDYLGRTMLTRLLACFALLTGLAAVGAPAQAALGEAIGTAMEVTQKRDDTAKSETELCIERQRQQRRKGEKITPCKSETITIFLPTVQFGPDRALE